MGRPRRRRDQRDDRRDGLPARAARRGGAPSRDRPRRPRLSRAGKCVAPALVRPLRRPAPALGRRRGPDRARARRDGRTGRAVPDDRRTRGGGRVCHARVPAVLRRATTRGREAGQRRPARRRLARSRRTRRGAGRRRARAGARQPPQSNRSRAPAERTRGNRGAVRGARGVGAGGRDPCAAHAPRRDPRPVARGVGCGAPLGRHRDFGLEGVQPGRAQGGPDRDRRSGRPRSRRPDARPYTSTLGCSG